MDLVWGEVDTNSSLQAFDQQGRLVAQITGASWPRMAWIHPDWCGIENGTLIRGIESWEEGRAVVEKLIAGYLVHVRGA